MSRMYYGYDNIYGNNITDSDGYNRGFFYIFDSKQARDAWVAKDESRRSSWTASKAVAEMTRSVLDTQKTGEPLLDDGSKHRAVVVSYRTMVYLLHDVEVLNPED